MSATSILVLVVVVACVAFWVARSTGRGFATTTQHVRTADVVCRLTEEQQAKAAADRTTTYERIETQAHLDGQSSAELYGLRMSRLHALGRSTRRQPGVPEFGDE